MLRADEIPPDIREDQRQFTCLEWFGWGLWEYLSYPAEWVDRMLEHKQLVKSVQGSGGTKG